MRDSTLFPSLILGELREFIIPQMISLNNFLLALLTQVYFTQIPNNHSSFIVHLGFKGFTQVIAG